ncbi:MAG: carboxypeptidase-like regulatory domain-containing protein, partial [Nitrospirota bacterium]
MRSIGCHLIVRVVCLCVCLSLFHQGRAGAAESNLIAGSVQNQDLRRVGQVLVEVKNQEGTLVTTGVSNDAGEFSIPVPADGTYSVSAIQD